MKKLRLIGFALGTSLALAGSAFGQDIAIGVVGPMTGGEAGAFDSIFSSDRKKLRRLARPVNWSCSALRLLTRFSSSASACFCFSSSVSRTKWVKFWK